MNQNLRDVTTLVHGDILYTKSKNDLVCHPDSWMVIRDGIVESILADKPEIENSEVRDYGNQLILPVFTDLHFHSVQYAIRGLGLNKELLPWLQTYTFKEETRFADVDYAESIFKLLINELWSIGSLNLCTFASLHLESTLRLMEMYDSNGFRAFVGKVNMDCNDDPSLLETSQQSCEDTRYYIEESQKFKHVKPIITPRFAPSCTPSLLSKLGEIANEYDLPVQSHLNETPGEIELVWEMFQDYEHYYDVYRKNGLTPKGKTIMAHCVHNTEPELIAMLEDQVYVAHCPTSNINLSSGIMPLRKMMDQGYNIGLGSDVAGGDRLFMGMAVADAIRSSKITAMISKGEVEPVTYVEAYYLATAGGGSFFGNTGMFQEGYSADYIVVEDACWPASKRYDLGERLEQFLYLGGGDCITHRCMRGEILEKPYD